MCWCPGGGAGITATQLIKAGPVAVSQLLVITRPEVRLLRKDRTCVRPCRCDKYPGWGRTVHRRIDCFGLTGSGQWLLVISSGLRLEHERERGV